MKSLFEQMSDTYRKENGYLAVIDKQVEDMFLLLVKKYQKVMVSTNNLKRELKWNGLLG